MCVGEETSGKPDMVMDTPVWGNRSREIMRNSPMLARRLRWEWTFEPVRPGDI